MDGPVPGGFPNRQCAHKLDTGGFLCAADIIRHTHTAHGRKPSQSGGLRCDGRHPDLVYRPPPKNDQEKRNFYWPCLCVCVLEQFAEFLFRSVADGPRLMETNKSSGRAFIDAAGHG